MEDSAETCPLQGEPDDRVERILAKIARRVCASSVLAGAAWLGACSAAHKTDLHDGNELPPGPERHRATEPDARVVEETPEAQASLLPCSDGNRALPVRAGGLRPTDTFDYLELRVVQKDVEAALLGKKVHNFTVTDKSGEPCASASKPACLKQLASDVSEVEFTALRRGSFAYSAVTTRGDIVQQWSGIPQLLQLLGPIDSADEALLLVAASNYHLTCGDVSKSSVRALNDGYEVYATQTSLCPITTYGTRLHVSTMGTLRELSSKVLETSPACVGRKPEGLLAHADKSRPRTLAAFLAQSAHLEDASVHAFLRMARELHAHRAPAALIARSQAAAEDEQRHSEQMRRLAEAHGARVEVARVVELPVRSLEQIALENSVEGCVHETYGALVGAFQAGCAQELSLRSSMLAIAEDEARHAALSHALHGWLIQQLKPEARERVLAARCAAVHALRAACKAMSHEPWHAQAGLPSPALAQVLIDELDRELWLVAA